MTKEEWEEEEDAELFSSGHIASSPLILGHHWGNCCLDLRKKILFFKTVPLLLKSKGKPIWPSSLTIKDVSTHLPPNSCIPSRANTTVKRKRRKSRLMMDFMELMRDTTKFLREAQYLEKENNNKIIHPLGFFFLFSWFFCQLEHVKIQQPSCNPGCHDLLSLWTVLLPHLLCDLKNPQKSQRPEHTDAKWHARPEETPHHLKDAADNNLQNMSEGKNQALYASPVQQCRNPLFVLPSVLSLMF